MKLRTSLALAALIAALAATASYASHNNPWAGDSAVVKSKNHDTNQSFSADRPGDEEMKGVDRSKGRDKVPGPGGRKPGKRK